MKKSFLLVFTLIFVLFLTSCAEKQQPAEVTDTTVTAQTREIVFSTDKDIGSVINAAKDTFDKTEEDDYDQEEPLSLAKYYVTLADGACAAKDGEGNDLPSSCVSFAGNTVLIKEIGTYVLEGKLTDGRVIVQCEDRIQLILNGIDVHCENAPAFETYGSGKKTVTLARGTENFLSDGVEERGMNGKVAVQARSTLLINGKGSLFIEGQYDGVVATQLKITDAEVSVKAQEKAVSSSGYVYVRGATVTMEGEKLLSAVDKIAFFASRIVAKGREVTGKEIWMENTAVELSGKGDGLVAERFVSAQACSFRLSVGGDGFVATGEGDEKMDGIVRLIGCTTVISDGDDGIRAKYLSLSSGTLLCYGMGTQLAISEGIDCSSTIQEVLLPTPIAKGKRVKVGEIETTFDREWRTFAYLGKQADGILYVDGEKYAVLW